MGYWKKTVLPTVIATTFTVAPVMAYEPGDFIARVGPVGVYPTGESDDLDAVPGGQVEADNAWSLGVTFSYMFTQNIGVGLLGAWPFEHDIEPKGALKDVDSRDVGETKHLPPTVTLQVMSLPFFSSTLNCIAPSSSRMVSPIFIS